MKNRIEFVDGDGLPDIAVDFGRDLSEIPTRQLKVFTTTGVYITKSLITDDAALGLCHAEFADGELPAGDHLFNVVTTELDGRQRTYPSSGSIPLLVRKEFDSGLRAKNKNNTITIRGDTTTLNIDVVLTDQRSGTQLLVGTPTDGDYTDGKATIVSTDTIANAVDAINVALTEDGTQLTVGVPTDGGYSDGKLAISAADTLADAVDTLNVGILNSANATLDALTFPVDYDTGITITAGTIFRTQAQMSAYLTDNAGTSFKYLQEAWDATPSLAAHNVVYNCAVGTHRPTAAQPNAQMAWALIGKSIAAKGVSIKVLGDGDTGNWDEMEAVQTITSHNAGIGTPSVTMSGATYTPSALKGAYVIISDTGMISAIVDNTADTIEISNGFILEAAPTNGVSTVRVITPGTRFANSLDDVAPLHVGAFTIAGDSTEDTYYIESIAFEVWSTGHAVARFTDVSLKMTNVQLDGDFVGASTTGIGLLLTGPLKGSITGFSAMCSKNSGFSYPIEIDWVSRGAASLSFQNIFISTGAGSGYGTFPILGGPHTLQFFGAVFDNCRVRAEDSTRIESSAFAFYFGRTLTFKDYPGPGPALDLGVGVTVGAISSPPDQLIQFEGCGGPCIRLNSGSIMGGADRDAGQIEISLINVSGGTANTDVGIEMSGSHNLLQLKSDSDVSGSAGDLRIDGVVGSYSEIGTRANPFVSTQNNVIGIG